MKRFAFLLLFGILLLPAPAHGADTKIQAVATIPDLADMARNIGGDLIDVTSLATGVEDIHAVPMKPSFALLLNRADVLFLMGLEAEHAFLPALLQAARNPRILRDAPGYIDCSVYITPLEVPTRIDRALGDIHPMGNPHFNLDPVSGKAMARAIADGLRRNYPEYASTFKKNLDAYLAKLDDAIARWESEATPLRGVKLVSYHPDMIYFAERFGMEAFGTIEIRAGVDPTPGHIAELEDLMRKEKVDLVVRELHYPASLAETVAQATGAKLVELPAMAGGLPDTKDYISFIDHNIRTMVAAVEGEKHAGRPVNVAESEPGVRQPASP
jgi:zinc/manganese transport system substrate-binding protein